MINRNIVLNLVAGTAIVATACGAEPTQPPAASSTRTTAAPTSSTDSPSTATTPAGTVIKIVIAGGEVTPINAQAEAAVGEPIALEVSSDAVDSIHVHSTPEQTFDVQARPDQRFEFTVEVPGRVDVELHELNRTIVTIAVRP